MADLTTLDSWDLSKLSLMLPKIILDCIMALFPLFHPLAKDFIIPTFVDHNGFVISCAYNAQLLSMTPLPDIEWIGKASMEPKVKFFF